MFSINNFGSSWLKHCIIYKMPIHAGFEDDEADNLKLSTILGFDFIKDYDYIYWLFIFRKI